MKVLTVSTVRIHTNGVTSVILNYFKNIDMSDMQMDFVVMNEISDEYTRILTQYGGNVYYIPRRKNTLSYMYGLYKTLKRGKYDIIHIHGNSATMVFELLPAFFAGVKVRIAHSHNTTCSHMKMHKLLKPLFNALYTHGFACGDDAGKWLFGKKDFTVLNNGIELSNYVFDENIRSEYRENLSAGDKKVLGHIGNFITQKNHEFLLDSFAELLKRDKNYLLVLFSDGALLDKMKQKTLDLGISENVRFMGKSSEIAQYLQAMDMFLLPSLHEGLPVVLVEAQAAGLSCLVSDKVAREANLSGKMTYLPIDNPKIWADAIENTEFSKRRENCEKWQQKISEKGYDIRKNAQVLKELYRSYLPK